MTPRLLFILLAFIFAGSGINLHAQVADDDDAKLVQFSGIIITADSLNPVPYAKLQVKSTSYGTASDSYGFFSFVAHLKDTVLFTAIGYKPASFIIPDTITQKKYSLIQLMTNDTLTLSAAIIFPWPTLEDFKKAFVETKIPDDEYEIAKKNLDIYNLRLAALDYPMDARMNYNNYIENTTSKLYYFGQQQPFNIFNPFAWAQFIKAWKAGKFKSKEERLKEQ